MNMKRRHNDHARRLNTVRIKHDTMSPVTETLREAETSRETKLILKLIVISPSKEAFDNQRADSS
jgi:hypothetical protein